MEEAGRRGWVVQIVGGDVDGDWLTWRWNDPDRPVGVHHAEGLRELVAAFRSALPREPGSNKRKSPCNLEQLVTLRTMSRQDELKRLGLCDLLTRRGDEPELMWALSQVLLPDDLRCQLIETAADRERVEARVTLSPPAVIVPWGLLVLDDDDMRLLDVTGVSQIAPVLPRDIDLNVSCVASATGDRVLHVAGPKISEGRVLLGTPKSYGCRGYDTEQSSAEHNSLEKLRAHLETGAGKIIRLLTIGHYTTGTGDVADTAFFMGDGETNKLRALRLVREAERWRVPPRVGVVTCASDTDLAQREPFGLGTTLLTNGAEVLQVVPWALPTGYAIGLMGTGTVGTFEWLTQAADHAQSDADLVMSLCDLQRKKLTARRERPGLGSSPLPWDALITMTAPAGHCQNPGSASTPQSSGYATTPWRISYSASAHNLEFTEQQGQQPASKSEKKRKRASERPRSCTRKILARTELAMLMLFLVASLAEAGAPLYLYATTKPPDPNSDFTTNTTFIYYGDGQEQFGLPAVQNRITLDYDKMPQAMKNVVVATENSTFSSDPKFSMSDMLYGLWTITRGGDVQGGSIITQQYIKILYLSSGRTAGREIRESILATKMGREAPKEKVLRGYLNTIYFGWGAYGTEAAAKSYFLKPVSELSLSGTAALVATLNNPAGLNLSANKKGRERLLGRHQYVFGQMLENRYTSQAERDAARPVLSELPEVPAFDRYGGPKGFLMPQVEQELSSLGFSDAEVQGGGPKVTTTLGKNMQDAAVATAQRYTKEAASKAKLRQGVFELYVAISSVDITTGGVLVIYGGPDYTKDSRDWLTTPRPATSTFKSFTTVAGLRSDYSLDNTPEGGTFTPRGDGIPVRNEFNEQHGDVTLCRAVTESVDTAFVNMTGSMKSGAPAVIQTANDAGTSSGAGWDVNSCIALGTAEVSPLDMANIYATLTGSGERKDVHFMARVVDRNDSTVYKARKEGTQTIGKNVVAGVTDALTSVAKEDTGTEAPQPKRPVVGKIGANGVDDSTISAWLVDYTRQISTTVMCVVGDPGNENLDAYERPGDKTLFGSGYPLTMWVEYMQTAAKGQEVKQFDKAKPIQRKSSAPSQASMRSAQPIST